MLLKIGNQIINTDHIVTVKFDGSHHTTITFSSGSQPLSFRADEGLALWKALSDLSKDTGSKGSGGKAEIM